MCSTVHNWQSATCDFAVRIQKTLSKKMWQVLLHFVKFKLVSLFSGWYCQVYVCQKFSGTISIRKFLHTDNEYNTDKWRLEIRIHKHFPASLSMLAEVFPMVLLLPLPRMHLILCKRCTNTHWYCANFHCFVIKMDYVKYFSVVHLHAVIVGSTQQMHWK